jgi:hypothetical protein
MRDSINYIPVLALSLLCLAPLILLRTIFPLVSTCLISFVPFFSTV